MTIPNRRPVPGPPPPPTGATEAIRTARRRRHRSRLAAGGGVAAVAGVVAALLLVGGGTQVLSEERRGEFAGVPTSEPSATPTPKSGSPAPSASADPAQTASGSPAPTSGAGGGPTGSPADDGKEPGQSPAPGQVGPAGYRTPEMRQEPGPPRQPVAGADFCGSSSANGTPDDGSPDVTSQFGWCLTAIDEVTSAGHRLALQVCRDESGDGRLSFNDSLETDLAILTGDREVWRWSTGRLTEGPAHGLEIGSSQCVRWVVDWTDVDGKGRALAPGDYRLVATTLAQELKESSGASATLRVT